MEIVGLSDKEVAYLLGLSKERYDEISTPDSHKLSFRESSAITELSIWLGSLLTVLEPSAVRDWLFLPGLGSDGRSPAAVIADGDAEAIDDFIDRANDIRIEFDASI